MTTMCTYCKKPAPRGASMHQACLEAYSLDHEPEGEEDARTWLDDRRLEMGQPPRWTERCHAPFQLVDEDPRPGVDPPSWVLTLVQLDTPGHRPQPHHGRFGSQALAVEVAGRLNQKLGVSLVDAARIVASSMEAPENVVDVIEVGGRAWSPADFLAEHGRLVCDCAAAHPGLAVAFLRVLSGLDAYVYLDLAGHSTLVERPR